MIAASFSKKASYVDDGIESSGYSDVIATVEVVRIVVRIIW